eukprot:1260688-Alexandrium_andersonii.AAC.1
MATGPGSSGGPPGCPSRTPVFNVYRGAVLEDVRERRKRAAEEVPGRTPGVQWYYMVDGRIAVISHLTTVGPRDAVSYTHLTLPTICSV